MPVTQDQVENAVMILSELIIVLENQGDIVNHAHDAAERTETVEAKQIVSEHVLRAALSRDPVTSLRASIDELSGGQ